MSDTDRESGPPNEVELIKDASNYLRGTIVEGLADKITYGIAASDCQLTKFHGTYLQDDRDQRSERRRQKLEPAYMFMVRVGIPGGVCTAAQWLACDELAHTRANGTLKLTTRQAFQFHGVIKPDLTPLMRGLNEALMTTLSACGDVNRNVMAGAHPHDSPIYDQMLADCQAVSDHLKPKTNAYQEIWLGTDKVMATTIDDNEPIYGKTYLPRKFKICFAIPPHNDPDIYTQDIGFVAIEKNGKLSGYNVIVGGGQGMTYGMPETYPRLGSVIGFCKPGQLLDVAETIVKIQRDNGNRSNRKRARFKYTIDDHGIDWIVSELNRRMGSKLVKAKPFEFTTNGDQYGWEKADNGNWFVNLYIEGGRVLDTDDFPMMTGLREIAKVHDGDFRLTGNQNLIIGNVDPGNKRKIDSLLKKYGLLDAMKHSSARLNSIACVALNTCDQAFSEAERYLPSLMDRMDEVIKAAGLWDDPIIVRMTGCPNGCGRPYVAEIGFTGKAIGKYNLYLGAGFHGERLNKMYKENIGEDEIIETLEPMIHAYAKKRKKDERFGDFCVRTDIIKATREGMDFHD